MNEAKREILELLQAHPAGLFGLEMVRLSNGALRRSTLYVHLGVMEEQGLIRAQEVHVDPLPIPRRRYFLNPSGRRALDASGEGEPVPA